MRPAISQTCIILLLTLSTAETTSALNSKDEWPGTTLSGTDCYGKPSNFGPFDYTDPETLVAGGKYRHKAGDYSVRVLVESAHFTPRVEQLIGGASGGLAADIDYTLRALPNNHRALWAMSRFYLREIDQKGIDAVMEKEYRQALFAPPECYFNRAKSFTPKDKTVWAISGIYLHRRGLFEAALAEYQEAEKEMPNSPELNYNIGLLYFDMGNFDKATEYAKRATELGYPLGGLNRKLKRTGMTAESARNTTSGEAAAQESR